MAHQIIMDVSSKFVLHKDVTVEVRKDGKKLGKALISKGNIEWVPAKNSVNKFRLTWTQFAKLMEENGKQMRMPE